jgi:putative flippase GtrA
VIDTVIARVVSSFVGFLIKMNKVFKTKEHTAATTAKYYIVTFGQMLVSAISVWLIQRIWHVDVVVIKMIVDFILFIIGFVLQREWVFKTYGKKTKK